MSTRTPRFRTQAMLSFSNAYKDLARRIGDDLQSANIEIRYDNWQGGGGAPAFQAVPGDIGRASFLLPLLTPSDSAPTWISDKWRRTVYDEACAQGIDVLPLRGEGGKEVVPEFLSRFHFADLSLRGYKTQMLTLVAAICEKSGNNDIGLPAAWGDEESLTSSLAPTDPIVLAAGDSLAPCIDGSGAGKALVDEMFPFMLDGLFYELGVQYPALSVRTAPDLPPWAARILINDVPEAQLEMRSDAVLVSENVEKLSKIGVDAWPAVNPVNGAAHAWIPAGEAPKAEQAGMTIWDTHGVLILLLSSVLRRKAADFLTTRAVRVLLGQVERAYPNTVAETVPKTVSLFVLTDVLRRLVVEGVSIRDLRRILLAMADWGRIEQDPLMLTEYARAALQRMITYRLSGGTNTLVVFLLDPEIEEAIRAATRYTATGSYVDIEPDQLRRILDAISEPMDRLDTGTQVPQILTVMSVRSSVRRLVAPSMPRLHVISYEELSSEVNIQPVGRITLGGFRGRAGVTGLSV